MSDESLMNLDFFNQQLAEIEDRLTEDHEFRKEIENRIDTVIRQLAVLPDGETYTLPKELMLEITKLLSKVELESYRFTIARQIHFNQMKQMKRDRRWNIIARLSKTWKR